jgi:hypothetical protein
VKKLETFLGKFIAFFSSDLFDAIALRRASRLFHFPANVTPFPPLFAREAKTLLCVVIIIDRVVSKY